MSEPVSAAGRKKKAQLKKKMLKEETKRKVRVFKEIDRLKKSIKKIRELEGNKNKGMIKSMEKLIDKLRKKVGGQVEGK